MHDTGENYPVFANGDAIRRITISDGSIKLYQFAKQNEQVTIAVYGYEIVNITSDDVEK